MNLMAVLTVILPAAIGCWGNPAGVASAAVAQIAYPGMTIIQGNSRCTMGYVDPRTGLGFSAGHCNTNWEVHDEAGDLVGRVITARHNRAGRATTKATDLVLDYEVIRIIPAVTTTDRLGPTFIPHLDSYPEVRPEPGMKVCHRGAATGQSCGEVDHVYNGWFTMTAGGGDLISDHGDSGGPVFAILPESRHPRLIGLFRGTQGNKLAAVTWADVHALTALPSAADISGGYR